MLVPRLLSMTNVTRIQSSNKAHSLARSSTGRCGKEYLPSTTLASRQSSVYLQQATGSLAGHHFAPPMRGSYLTSSCRGWSMLTRLMTAACSCGAVAVVKSCLDERALPSWVGSESDWGSVMQQIRQKGKTRLDKKARACEKSR